METTDQGLLGEPGGLVFEEDSDPHGAVGGDLEEAVAADRNDVV